MRFSPDGFQWRFRLLLGAAFLCVTLPASANYTITDLGANIRPYDISNNGIIAGSNANASPFVSFAGTAGAFQPPSSSGLESQANAVNSNGLAVGYNFIDGTQRRAFLRAPGSALSNFDVTAIETNDASEFDHITGTALVEGRRLGFVYNLQNQSMLLLPTFGGAESRANGISNLGHAVGAAQNASGAFIGFRALYGSNNITNLGTLTGFTDSEASAVNDSSHVVGWVSKTPASTLPLDVASSKRAFVWVPVTGATGVQDLGTIGADVGSVANDINNAGYVVGHSAAADGNTRAFFHDRKATDIRAITGNATDLYLGTSNGVYRSSDGGVTISARSNGLTELRVTALSATNDPQIIYAGTAQGVFRTGDAGASWQAVNTGLMFTDNTVSPAVVKAREIASLAVHPADPAIVMAATSNGVYRTTDSGASWTLFNSGMGETAVSVNELRAVPVNTNVYAATNSGIFASTFEAQAWNNISGTGLSTSAAVAVTTVDVEYTSSGSVTAIYAGTPTGVFKIPNTTSPILWTSANGSGATGLPAARVIRRLKFHKPTNGTVNILYAALAGVGIYKTTNGGNAWEAITTTGLTNLDALAFTATPIAPPTLYMGTLSGLFRFTDPTSTRWTPTNNMQDLNALIPAGTGWVLRNATAINNAGQIVGWGDLGTEAHGFLLTPATGIPTAQLTVVKSLPAPPYQQFVPVNYSLTVTNNGPASATSILLTDWLPKEAIFRTAQGANCTNTDSVTLTCQLGDLEAGKSRKITIIVSPDAPNVSLNNVARVVANESDPAFSDNTSAVEAKTNQCFIATAAYGSFLDPHVQTLRHFRDEYLLSHAAGRMFVEWYYHASPPLAAFIAQHDSARMLTRLLLAPVVYMVQYPVMAWVVMIALMAGGIRHWRRRSSRRVGVIAECKGLESAR